MINDPRLALQSLLAPPQHPQTRAGYSVASGPSGMVPWALPVLASNLPLYERVLWVDTSGRFDPRRERRLRKRRHGRRGRIRTLRLQGGEPSRKE